MTGRKWPQRVGATWCAVVWLVGWSLVAPGVKEGSPARTEVPQEGNELV
jgi:hypothetical protein